MLIIWYNIDLDTAEIEYYEQLEKVEAGMSVEDLDELIGTPQRIIEIDAPLASYIYEYRKPEGFSGFFELAVDSTLQVVDITNALRREDFSNSKSKDVLVNNNLETIKEVELGMNQQEVEKIMGRPYRILEIESPTVRIVFLYEVPEGISAVCDITFDSTMHVVDVAFQIFPQDSTSNLE
ncbi:MAG: hypothetical protein ED557_11920 [Balneola sp.]|nr:MAG: hypothetical protein ED557_11920 [Balneola sp.]